MVIVLNCLLNDGFMTIALYIQGLKNGTITISRIIIEKNASIFYTKSFAIIIERLYLMNLIKHFETISCIVS